MKRPFFSIIIPAHARPQQLALCLEALQRLNYSRDRFEVIVVDDGSQPPLDAAVAPLQEKLPLRLVSQQNAGPATARNTGASLAQGQFLAFTDDDCRPAPDWLQALADRFGENPDCVIGGQTFNALPGNLYATASQMLIDYLYRYFNAGPDGALFFTSNNLALPAERFRSVGGFDTSFTLAAAEDREFCHRLIGCGCRLLYAPEVRIEHAHPLALRTCWRQHFNYGRGAFHFHQSLARSNDEPIRVEPLTFYLKLVCYPLSQRQGWRVPGLMFLLALSQAANAAGFFWQHLQRGR